MLISTSRENTRLGWIRPALLLANSVFSLILSALQQMPNSKLTAQSRETQRFSTTQGQLGNYLVIQRELASPPPSSFPTSHGLASSSSIPWVSHKLLVYSVSSPTQSIRTVLPTPWCLSLSFLTKAPLSTFFIFNFSVHKVSTYVTTGRGKKKNPADKNKQYNFLFIMDQCFIVDTSRGSM